MGWISVKDKLPTGYHWIEEGLAEPEEYIVHVKGAEASTTGMFDGKKFVKSVFEDIGGFADEIDYWMPLPNPPAETDFQDAVTKNQNIYRAALDRWGAQMQTVVAIEELSELQKELCKALRGMQHNNHIAEEIADVSIMLEQMTMLYHVRDAVLDWKKRKLERLARRVKGEDDA